MKTFCILLIASTVIALGTFAAAQDGPIDKAEFKTQLEGWLPGMGGDDIGQRNGPQQSLQNVCFQAGAPGREADRATVCQVLAEALGTEMAPPARVWLLTQLQWIGREECVEAVAKSLDDGDAHVRDAARRALENNPAPGANAALAAKVKGASGSLRVGLINSLGSRGDEASVGTLTGLLRDRDGATVAAAANALGKITGSQAARALKDALRNAPDASKAPIADAYLRCADKLLAQGKKSEALAIYNELATDKSPKAIRLAALRGKLNAAGGK